MFSACGHSRRRSEGTDGCDGGRVGREWYKISGEFAHEIDDGRNRLVVFILREKPALIRVRTHLSVFFSDKTENPETHELSQ